MYAIVDIETTGGYASANGITEVAIILHDGKEIEGKYQTLVNPQQSIPRYITALTGITNEMVTEAPAFAEVSEYIYRLLHDRIFVAHNVNFDYSFIRHHLSVWGFHLDVKKLCTVRLGRKVFPGFPSYSLGNLCRSLSIGIEQRHRAMGDATATAVLFEKILQSDTENHLVKMLKRGSREAYLPINLPAEHIQQLPYSPGVYYFHDQKDTVIYVGKAKNLRYRVTSHFSNNTTSKRKQELIRNVYRISFEPCGTEFMAGVLESIEIKRLWPQYNFSQKKWEFSYGLFCYEDQKGLLRLGIERKRKNFLPLYTFNYLLEGHNLLWQLVKQFGLCPKLCFLQTDSDPCVGLADGYCNGACEGNENAVSYNEKVQLAIQSLKENMPTFALLEEGRHQDEQSCVLLEHGKFYGMGFVPAGLEWSDRDQLKSYLTQYAGNEYVRSMILKHAETHPQKKYCLDDGI